MSDTTQIVKDAVRDAVMKAVRLPTNDAPSGQAGQIAAQTLQQPAVEKLVAVVEHATNNEPWYQSRVTLGALLAAIAGVLGIFGWAFPAEMQGKVIDLIIALAPLIGGALALYGRWAAKKPIGA